MWGVGMHLYTRVHGDGTVGPALRWEEPGTCTSALNVYAGWGVRQGVESVIVTGLFRSCWLTLWRCWFVAAQDSLMERISAEIVLYIMELSPSF